MNFIETKYGIGDVVWRGFSPWAKEIRPCDDCESTGKWTGTIGPGITVTVECMTCKGRKEIVQWRHRPLVEQLAIVGVHLSHEVADMQIATEIEYDCIPFGQKPGEIEPRRHEQDALLSTKTTAEVTAIGATILARKTFEINKIKHTYNPADPEGMKEAINEIESRAAVSWLEPADVITYVQDRIREHA